jgi:hypothetical protein
MRQRPTRFVSASCCLPASCVSCCVCVCVCVCVSSHPLLHKQTFRAFLAGRQTPVESIDVELIAVCNQLRTVITEMKKLSDQQQKVAKEQEEIVWAQQRLIRLQVDLKAAYDQLLARKALLAEQDQRQQAKKTVIESLV